MVTAAKARSVRCLSWSAAVTCRRFARPSARLRPIPRKQRHRVTLAVERDRHRAVARLAVEDRDAAAVAVEEGRRFDAVAALRGADPVRAGKDEAAGMAEHIIFDVAGDRAGRRIDGDDAAAIAAAAVVRAMRRIEREVPQQGPARPVVGRADDQLVGHPAEHLGDIWATIRRPSIR